MSTFKQNEQVTFIEVAKTIGPDGDLLTTAEVLDEVNEIMEDAVWKKANNNFSHVGLVRNSLPQGEVRDFNAGVSTQAATRERIEDVIMMRESYTEADVALVNASGDPAGFMMDEARAKIEGIGQGMTADLIYGNHATDISKMTGLAPRLATVDSERVWNNGGSGSDVSSIYGVEWGIDTCHMIFPEGGVAGLDRKWLGEDTTTDSNSKKFQVLREHFKFHYGLHVRNAKSIIRIANIETAGSSNTFNEDILIKALMKMVNKGRRTTLYCNDTIYSQILIRAKDKANVNLVWSTAFGEDTITFLGRPIRMVDQILNTETAIS
jgi:hypothetical protein